MICAMFTTSAQSRSGYFLENYTYGYQLNPSFGDSRNFVSLPGVGNLNIGISGTLHMDKVLFNTNGRTTTFMNPSVSASTFLDGINENNRIGNSNKIGIISAGFKSFKGYSTISISTVTNVNTRIPKSLFSLLKQGLENTTYDISNFDTHADAYVEVALGHSHNITKNLRVGATVKALVGGGNVDAQFKNAHLTLGENNWVVQTDAMLQASVKGLSYKHSYNETTKHEYVSGAELNSPGINGFGIAFDLGATYKLNNDWTFSTAILDLGCISWKNNIVAKTNGVQTFETDKYTFSVDDDSPNNFSDELDKMKDNLSSLYELEDMGDTGSRNKMLATTFNIGAQYNFPLYRNLSFGLLNTTRLQGEFTWTEFRLSANIQPVKVFSASVNMAYGTYGAAFGWIANVKVPGFNLFVGMDHTVGKLCKQYIPLSSNAQLSLGVNIAF